MNVRIHDIVAQTQVVDGDSLLTPQVMARIVRAVMQARPHTIRSSALAVAAAELMELHRITAVAVLGADGVQAGRLVGLLTIGDLMRAKVV